MSKNFKILLGAGVTLLLIIIAFVMIQSQTGAQASTNSVADVQHAIADKTFRTKTEAYNALANEKESFYNRPANAFEKTPVTSPSSEPNVDVGTPATTPSAARKPAPVENPQFETAYRAVEQNVKQIYGEDPISEPAAVTSKPQPRETDEERRRKAMQRDWQQPVAPVAESNAAASSQSSTFRAVIHGTQVIKSGQPALLRTKEPITYGGITIPANTLLSGVTSISDTRLTVKIEYVRIGQSVYSIPLTLYGSDGMPGMPLNYDAVSKITNSQTSSTALQETSNAVSRYGGTIGRVAGTILSSAGSQVQNIKNIEIKLIDNQTVILKITER